MTIGEALRASTDELERAGVDSPRLDAELLLAHALGFSRAELYAHTERALTEADAARMQKLVERRRRREPLAYVLGEWGFRRLTLRTDPRALAWSRWRPPLGPPGARSSTNRSWVSG